MTSAERGAETGQPDRSGIAHPTLPFTAYRLHDGKSIMPLVPAAPRRAWMDASSEHFAYHCLPMVIANQAGWMILSAHDFKVLWSGGDDLDDLRVFYISGDEPYPAVSMFGHGILTFHIPYLFRTPPGYNTLVRGPANCPKDGVCPLEGVVETDWTPATFTMNWQVTRPNETIAFSRAEPICMVVPQPRGDLERFEPRLDLLAADETTHRDHLHWARRRREFIGSRRLGADITPPTTWQKHYKRGVTMDGTRVEDHQSVLRLSAFRDQSGAPQFVEAFDGEPRAETSEA